MMSSMPFFIVWVAFFLLLCCVHGKVGTISVRNGVVCDDGFSLLFLLFNLSVLFGSLICMWVLISSSFLLGRWVGI